MNTSRTRIDAEHGTFHTGPGSQYVFYHQYFSVPGTGPEPRSRPLAVDFLAGLRRRFEPPPGFGEARRVLARERTVLIEGQQGSGRSAAARMLLYEYRELREGLREVATEDDRGNVRLDSRKPDRPEGLLLDLSEVDESTWRALQADLPSLHAAASTSDSRLAVVLPAGLHANALHPDLIRLKAVVHRPDAELVLHGALRAAGLARARVLPEDVKRFLRHEPPLHQVAHLASLIASEAASGRTAEFPTWCRAAVGALTRRPEDVARHVVALPDGRLRALLLTTAMLHGAPSDVVYEACESLLATVGHPGDDRPLLDREDLSARFTEIKASPGRAGLVTFTEMDYDIAIRTHFWDNMPGLRQQFGTWIAEAVTLDNLRAAHRDLLVERFVEQVLRTGTQDDFQRYVERWADHADSRLGPAAARALTYGCLHPRHGRRIRKVLYTWATSPQLTPARAGILTEVCSGELADHHPEQAMVRLHHVARRAASREAEVRLVQLVLRDHRLHHRMLERLAHGLTKPQSADIRLFTGLAVPSRLTAPLTGSPTPARALIDVAGVRACLTECWTALFDRVPQAKWREPARLWFSAAEDVEAQHRDHLLDILVQACRAHPYHLARLYTLALPHSVAPMVLARIDAVQGLRPNVL